MKGTSSPAAPRACALALGAAAGLLPTLAHRSAAAAETRSDVETDHIDAFDDEGPRSFGAFAKTGVTGLESSQGGVGFELDFGLGEVVAISLGGEWLRLGASTGQALTLGIPIFPGRVAFHGLCVHPRFTWALYAAGGGQAQRGSAGATVGWEWTATVGFTARLEAGLVYERWFGIGAETPPDGVRPAADAAIGWVF
jgi:hypothetical protein